MSGKKSKRGKKIHLDSMKPYRIKYGTVDKGDPIAIYLDISTWASPKQAEISEKYETVIRKLRKRISDIIYFNTDKLFNKNRFIVDLDLRTSGIEFGKRSFLNLECTLYQKEPIKGIKNKEIHSKLQNLSDKLIEEVFNNNEYFKFYRRKTK